MLSPFLICPPNTPLSPHPSPCSPTQPLPLPGSGIPLHWGIKPLQDQGPPPLMTTRLSSATYASGATCTLWLVL